MRPAIVDIFLIIVLENPVEIIFMSIYPVTGSIAAC